MLQRKILQEANPGFLLQSCHSLQESQQSKHTGTHEAKDLRHSVRKVRSLSQGSKMNSTVPNDMGCKWQLIRQNWQLKSRQASNSSAVSFFFQVQGAGGSGPMVWICALLARCPVSFPQDKSQKVSFTIRQCEACLEVSSLHLGYWLFTATFSNSFGKT